MSLAITVLPVLSVLFVATPIPKRTDKSADYYPLKLGNRWEYQAGSTTITTTVTDVTARKDGMSASTIETRVNDAVVATEVIAVSDKGLFHEKTNNSPVNPPLMFLKFPVKANATWAADAVCGVTTIGVTYTVHESEDIKVPAGKFKAVRVESRGAIGGAQTGATFWFAPDTGIVKLQYPVAGGNDTVLELKAFTPGKK